mmetsp:Transcript_36848/g.59601  ORF Transcript_36848/g.59601 Transcript_36848/m.59601 type:complete len:224 (-) Transcript_36848:406-1077(-)
MWLKSIFSLPLLALSLKSKPTLSLKDSTSLHSLKEEECLCRKSSSEEAVVKGGKDLSRLKRKSGRVGEGMRGTKARADIHLPFQFRCEAHLRIRGRKAAICGVLPVDGPTHGSPSVSCSFSRSETGLGSRRDNSTRTGYKLGCISPASCVPSWSTTILVRCERRKGYRAGKRANRSRAVVPFNTDLSSLTRLVPTARPIRAVKQRVAEFRTPQSLDDNRSTAT